MNDTKIESLLRQAPCPPAPAGLNQQLLADIRLPRAQQSASLGTAEAALFWRRWVPSLSFGLFFLGCLIVLGMQTSQLLNLRRENKSLRAVTAGLEQLREENAELEKLRAANQETERRRKESEELLKLKVEVDELRGRAQELPALRAENQRLQAERAAAVAKAGITPEADPLAEQMAKAERIQCVSNMKQIGLAARMWANDHQEIMPSVFLTMSNELNTPKILTCPSDTTRRRIVTWQEFDGSSVSYEMLSPGVPEGDPAMVYVRCPIHNNAGLLDGSVQMLGENLRVEKVDGKFKIVRVAKVVDRPQPTQP